MNPDESAREKENRKAIGISGPGRTSWHRMVGHWSADSLLPGMEPSQGRAPWTVPLQADGVFAARNCPGRGGRGMQCKLVALSLFLPAQKLS